MLDAAFTSFAPARFLLPGAFAIVSATAAVVHPVPTERQFRKDESSVRPYKDPMTTSRHFRVEITNGGTSDMSEIVTEDVLPQIMQAAADDSWVEAAERSGAWNSVFESLAYLGDLDDGWQGRGSVSASEVTQFEARVLAELLHEELPDGPVPMVGLDSDGFVVMTWEDGGLFGNLSVFGDGSYAYYFEREVDVVKDGDARTSQPLSEDFLRILRA